MISTARLLILGMLARAPMHGHQIRREAELRNMENWGGIKPGALYGTLKRLHDEGLVEPVSTERTGNLPARTIYAITEEGRTELRILLSAALQNLEPAISPFDVGLLVADAKPPSEVAELIARRAAKVKLARDRLRDDRLRLQAAGDITPVEAALSRHGEMHLDAELRWLAEIDGLFADGTTPLRRTT